MRHMQNRQLLFSVTKKDLEITYFNGTGKGGQNRNKVSACVHMKHPDSGVMVTAQRERSREQNMQTAFKALVEHPKFKAWHRVKCAQMMMTQGERDAAKKRLEDEVDKMMDERHLKIEVRDDRGNWRDDTPGEII
jgi:protein subunit release factor B